MGLLLVPDVRGALLSFPLRAVCLNVLIARLVLRVPFPVMQRHFSARKVATPALRALSARKAPINLCSAPLDQLAPLFQVPCKIALAFH